jgi:hypothetical protein
MFNAFSPMAGGNLDTYFRKTEYPYDLDASLDYVRPATGISPFPYPLTIGYINGLIPLHNDLQYSMMHGKLPDGPWTGAFPANNNAGNQLQFVFPDMTGGLRKVKG